MRVIVKCFVFCCFFFWVASLRAQSFNERVIFDTTGIRVYSLPYGTLVINSPAKRSELFNIFPRRKAGVFSGQASQFPLYYSPRYVGDSKTLTVSWPVKSGMSFAIHGEDLTHASTGITITNLEGANIVYKDTEVLFDDVEQLLVLSMHLSAGLYTIDIPVADGIVSKTVVVQ